MADSHLSRIINLLLSCFPLFFLSPLQYKTHKDKGVAMGARSLVSLFRIANPNLLVKKDRGKPSENGPVRVAEYGYSAPHTNVPGAELLEQALVSCSIYSVTVAYSLSFRCS